MSQGSARPLLQLAGMPLVAHLARAHWKALTLAFLAVLGATLADVLEPWPIKIVVDNLLQGKKLPGPWAAFVFSVFGGNALAILNFALASVFAIAGG